MQLPSNREEIEQWVNELANMLQISVIVTISSLFLEHNPGILYEEHATLNGGVISSMGRKGIGMHLVLSTLKLLLD